MSEEVAAMLARVADECEAGQHEPRPRYRRRPSRAERLRAIIRRAELVARHCGVS